jgi:hypothetical protein
MTMTPRRVAGPLGGEISEGKDAMEMVGEYKQ